MTISDEKRAAIKAALKKTPNVRQAMLAVGGVSYPTVYGIALEGKYKITKRSGVRDRHKENKKRALKALKIHPNATHIAKALKLPVSTVTGWAEAADIFLKPGGSKRPLPPLPKNLRPAPKNHKRPAMSASRKYGL